MIFGDYIAIDKQTAVQKNVTVDFYNNAQKSTLKNETAKIILGPFVNLFVLDKNKHAL